MNNAVWQVNATESGGGCESAWKVGRCGLVFFLLPGEEEAMSSIAFVAIHPSQFPEKVRRDLLQSLRARQVQHKFHYDSIKQAQKWLALHQAYSPSRNDVECQAIYQRSFFGAAERLAGRSVHLVGLGCGGGQKDTRLVGLLQERRADTFYTPVDVSTALVLVARETALRVMPAERCTPLVCDLAFTPDLPEVIAAMEQVDSARIVTFFGMLPNFEPTAVLPRIAALLRSGDHLLISANLAPGADYAAGVKKILPLYDNALTREWLLTFLFDLGVERGDGDLQFVVEDCPGGSALKRVAAYFCFSRDCAVRIESETFIFSAGEKIRLFFSYRHSPALVREALEAEGLSVVDQWVTPSEEEGVFLCERVE